MNGIKLIADERARQISVEGWSAEHDDQHVEGSISEAGSGYAHTASLQLSGHTTLARDEPYLWPWDSEWWKPSDDPIRNLVKAGALIAAEIDRLLRAKGEPVTPDPVRADPVRELPHWLLGSAQALLDLDERDALVPHGIGGHARAIITAFLEFHRAESPAPAQPPTNENDWLTRKHDQQVENAHGHRDRMAPAQEKTK